MGVVGPARCHPGCLGFIGPLFARPVAASKAELMTATLPEQSS